MADRIKNYQQEADQITTLKAIRTDLGVAPSSYTPDATVVTKDRVATFSQAEEELAVLGDIEKGVKQQVVKGGIADKRITNIEKLLQGNLYDYQTDSNSAYTKTVLAGAMPYASLDSVGGKTLVWNQLVDSGTTTVATISGHKYYTLIDGTASIVTADGTAITIVDDTADMVTDLTLCYGSGNEPTTVAEFQQTFPAVWYAYNKGQLLSAGVTSVVSKKADTTEIATYSIPASIQALEGYGWSAGTAYNYIDYERKVFVQRVGSVDMGTLSWMKNEANYRIYSTGLTTTAKPAETSTTVANALCDFLPTVILGTITVNHLSGLCISTVSPVVNIGIGSNDSTALDNLITSLNGKILYYELATPVETDISAYLTDDNLIQVESGGTLTFPNSNGDDYRINVPSAETYMVDLQSALGE